MSGDPLSRDVSTPSASSTESAPEVTSRCAGKEAAELEQEVVSTSGCQVDDEVEEVAVSCDELVSQITSEECMKIVRTYALDVTEPTDLERALTPLAGHVTLSEIYLRFRVRFPLNLFFIAVLQYFGLTGFQITPNGWAHMIGLFGLVVE